MKKIFFSITVIIVFTISSFNTVLAKPGKNENSLGQTKHQVQTNSSNSVQEPKKIFPNSDREDNDHGQAKIKAETREVQINITTPSSIEEPKKMSPNSDKKDGDNEQNKIKVEPSQGQFTVTTSSSIGEPKKISPNADKKDDDHGQAKIKIEPNQGQITITTPSSIEKTNPKNESNGKALGKIKKEVFPSVIKIGNLQIPTSSVTKGFKADLNWDKATNTITISKDGVTIKFVGDSLVYVNGVQINIANVKYGKGKLVPMDFIQKTLNSKQKRTTTGSGINTTSSAITTSGSAINTTGSAVTTSGSAINTTSSAITTSDSAITTTGSAVTTTGSTTTSGSTTTDPASVTTESAIFPTDPSTGH